jgi:NADH-quinone oxidoreductase subunit C
VIRAETVRQFEETFEVVQTTLFRDETTLAIRADDLKAACRFCRDTLGFDYLLDICGVDHIDRDPRFDLVYELYAMEKGEHLRLKIALPESDPAADTVSDLWPTANWHEREIWDMMGIRFADHPDLRRILMWEGYPFFPLRKDFPLEGKPSDVPEVAFTGAAPLDGGPFVTRPSTATTKDREPRSRG